MRNDPITDRQRSYLLSLAAKRKAPKLGATPDERVREMTRLLNESDLTRGEASTWIDRLLSYDVDGAPTTKQATTDDPVEPVFGDLFASERPRNDPPNRLRPKSASGPGDSGIDVRPLGLAGSNGKARYALVDPADDTLKFVIVRAVDSDESRWNGWTFVDIQAGPQTYPLGKQKPGEHSTYYGKSLDLVRALAALDDAGRDDAMAEYGRRLWYCGKCGADLTDETSRARGIGPYCEGRASGKPRNPDWPTIDELVEAVKQYARDNYNGSIGADYIVECYSDDDLRDLIGPRVRTVAGAIKKVWAETGVATRAEVREDIRNA